MPAAFCIPPQYVEAFKQGVMDGSIDPDRMRDMSSADRRRFLEPFVGKENARDVNALFESKLLLKDQQRGLANWARKVAAGDPAKQRDLARKISKMDRILSPADEESFLGDLAQQKLGVEVTADEARQIGAASERVQQAMQAWDALGRSPDAMKERLAYGRALQDLHGTIESMKPHPGFWSWNTLWNVTGIPKAVMTGIGDFSAFAAQGFGMMYSRQEAWSGLGQMFKYFASEDHYRDLNAWIVTHPDYDLAIKAKLGLTELGDKLTAREEAIQTTLVEAFNHYLSETTGVPNLVRATSRAYTGYLNYLRANVFFDLVKAARAAGEDVGPRSQTIHDLAKAVNDFTGRGNIGLDDEHARFAPILNSVFFAPRKISATINMFNPQRYLDPRISRTARIASMRQLVGMVAGTATVLGLFRAMGAEVSLDPDSNDFLKVKIGDTKFDISGGNATYLRLLARIITGRRTNQAGDETELNDPTKPFGQTYADEILKFFRGKLAPVAGFLADAAYGKTGNNRPFNITDEMSDKLMPMTMNSFIQFAINDPENYAAMIPMLASIFGINVQPPNSPPVMSNLNYWGQPAGHFDAPLREPIDRELEQLGYNMNFPLPVIQGMRLNDQQYHEYIRISGENAKINIENDMSLPGWEDFPKEQKLRMIRSDVSAARKDAADQLMADDLSQSPEGESLMDRATALKNQQYGINP